MTKLYVVGSKVEPMLTLTSPHHTAFFQSAWGPTELRGLENRRIILDVQHVSDHGVSVATTEQIVMAINLLNPSLVVIPDVLRNSWATIKSAFDFFGEIRWTYRIPPFEFMFVPQGNTLPEWRRCLSDFQEFATWGCSYTSTIGVPKILHQVAIKQGIDSFHRFELLKYIPEKFKVHMLGCWGGWEEMRQNERVESWDTSLPIAAAQYNVLLQEEPSNMKYQLIEDKEVDDPRVVVANAQFLAGRLEI